jgi:hypothetical protein
VTIGESRTGEIAKATLAPQSVQTPVAFLNQTTAPTVGNAAFLLASGKVAIKTVNCCAECGNLCSRWAKNTVSISLGNGVDPIYL